MAKKKKVTRKTKGRSQKSRVRGGGREAPLMKPGERARLEQQNAEDTQYVEQAESGLTQGDSMLAPDPGDRNLDVMRIKNRIKRRRGAIAHMTPVLLKGAAKNTAFAELKRLKEELKPVMMSTWDIGAFPDPKDPEKDHQYRQAVEKAKAGEVGNEAVKAKILRVRKLAAQIDPTNPDLARIERSTLRTD